MTVNRTTLLDLPLPVTGTESGTWGDTTNNGLTQYLDIAIAGSLVLSADSDTTLSSTEGDSSATNIGGTTAQYAVLRCTGARTATRNINAPAWTISGGTLTNYSKIYIVVNETTGSQNIVLRATNSATPTYTTGVTIVPGERAVCAWNGSDFVKVGGAAGGSNTQVQYNNNGVFGGVSGATTNGTAITFSTTNLKLQGSSTGVSSFASANSSASDYTYTFPAANTTIPVATQTLTFSGPTAARTITLPDANFTAARTDAAQTFTGVQTFSSNPILSGGTANGVLYLNGSSVATSGSALTFDGTTFAVTNASASNAFFASKSADGNVAFFRRINGTYNPGMFISLSDTINNEIIFNSTYSSGNAPSYVWQQAGTERMRLDSTGLGIGTTSPSYQLDTSGTASTAANSSATGSSTRFRNIYTRSRSNSAGISGDLYADQLFHVSGGANFEIYNADNYALVFGTNATERARITSGGDLQISSGGSFQVGGTAARATTAGTNRVDIFNGTAPVGTLTNGISLYSSSGEAYVMDAAGNATLFSPHDAETNEWVFKSKHTPTGKVLKIDVEKLLRFVNDHFGLDAVHEFIES
jgi:hypothetical protein